MKSTDLSRDPFGSDIVTTPREIEPAVDGLNKLALDTLVASFEHLASASVPRLGGEQSALLVLSPQPGHGKSHLIGRLFRALDDDATLLYLRPFQDLSSCWVSILEKTVAELDCPDAADKLHADRGEPTQLDTLVRRVLMAMMTPLLQDRRVPHPDPDRALELFARDPQTALEMPGFRQWMQHKRSEILPALDSLLRRHGIALATTRLAWLNVLLAYAYSEDDASLRQLCLDWITYREISDDEGKALGLRRADLPEGDLPYEQRNERCFERLKDLFTIGSYYRPFLLCFDQTELYGATPELARTFGVVISRLRRETCNQLTLVTANQNVWQERVVKHFEEADQHAFDPQPIELEGMTQQQAEQLVRNRLAVWEASDGADEFCSRVIPSLFREHTHRSVREVLRSARAAWRSPRTGGKPPTSANKLRELFESYRLKLLSAPKDLDFDSGVLQWSVENVLGPAVGAKVSRIKSPKGHLTVEWSDGKDRRELFGFESGSNWKRWEAIVREASKYHRDARPPQRVRAVFLRFPRQKALSDRTIKDIDQHHGCLHVTTIEQQDAAALFAAHDLIADIEQGNQDVSEEEGLSFLRTELRLLAERVWTNTSSRPTTLPPPDLARAIEGVVRAKRFVTLVLLRAQLPKAYSHVSDDELVTTAATIQGIKAHIAPASKVLQWLQ